MTNEALLSKSAKLQERLRRFEEEAEVEDGEGKDRKEVETWSTEANSPVSAPSSGA